MDCLVSDSLFDEIIISWKDAQTVGALKISDDFDIDASTCSAIKNLLPVHKQKEFVDDLIQKFTCLSDTILDRRMKGDPMVINLTDDLAKINPKRYYTPIPTPLHFKDAANALLDELIEKGVIRQIKLSSTPKFCARGFFVAKPGGISKGIRLVVDHKEANRYIKRPVHPFTSGTKLIKDIPRSAQFFAKIDCLWGYYQVPIAEESKHITTFICDRGTFEYNCAPMGLNCSGDEFCRRSDSALQGAKGYLKLVDDILVYGDSMEQLKTRLEDILQRCQDNGITISKKKIEVGTCVTFAGFDVSAEGYTPTADRYEAIKNFATPKNLTGARSFHGLTQGFYEFAPELAQISEPITKCLSTKTAFNWGPDQEESMQKIKTLLTSNLVLKNFDPSLKTQLITDASKIGIGFVLRQQEAYGKWRLIQCGSRCLNGPESRYAVCEIEALAILYAIEKCRHFLLGMEKFEVFTDHKSLRGVFEKDLASVENVRLRRCMERLQEYNFNVTYIEGKNNKIADTLSRFPVTPVSGSAGALDDPTCICKYIQNTTENCYHQEVHSIQDRVHEPDPKLQELIDSAKQDHNYQLLVKNIQKYKYFGKYYKKNKKKKKILGPGPEGTNLPPDSAPGEEFWAPFQRAWGLLSIHPYDLAVFNNDRIVVPESCRDSIICEIHKCHPGESKSLWRFRRDYWWPGYSDDIKSHIRKCKECIKFLPSQQIEPIINQNVATHPMEIIGLDLWQSDGMSFLVLVDQFSGFPMVQKLPSISSSAVIHAIAWYFNLLGNPRVLMNDQGKQLTSQEFKDFAKKRGIKVIYSSAYNPAANGLAESAVKNVKKLFQQCGSDWRKFDDSLQHWRDTPNKCGYSPGDIFFARRMKTSLPVLPGKTSLNTDIAQEAAKNRKELRSKEYEKRASHALPELNVGDKVFVQDHDGRKHWTKEAVIIGKRGPRGYDIKMDNSLETSRDRKHLRPINSPDEPPVYVIPDDWIRSELDAIDPLESAAETSHNELPDSDEDTEEEAIEQADEPHPEEPPPPDVRRSTRIANGKKSCHSCIGCKLIYNYLNVIDNFKASAEKLPQILRWAVTY